MNHNFPVFTVENECHDCYKCIRHCPAKAIKIKDGSASIIPELCVACGTCVKICPAGAKHIRNDASRAKFILASKKKVIAALAPSWRSAFKDASHKQLADALKKLGFHEVSEVALGAQAVSATTVQFLNTAPNGLYLSSACPAAVDYIGKYIPEYTKRITNFLSPALTHAKMLKDHFGPDTYVIFFGPCAAKKQEAEKHPEILSLSLTFRTLMKWFDSEKIDIREMAGKSEFQPGRAAEGRLYALEGGMLETIRANSGQDTRFLAVSGLHNIERILAEGQSETMDAKLFVECLACEGGCTNGPGMPEGCGQIADIARIANSCRELFPRERKYNIDLQERISPQWMTKTKITEAEIKVELEKIGKLSVKDELNCGGCGYQSCRHFARAVIAGKAEPSMCLSYLRKLAQKKSNALVKYIPAGVVIADKRLAIIESNVHFSNLFGESTQLAFEVAPGLHGVNLRKIVDFIDLFETSLSTGKDVIRNNFLCGDKIFNISIFTVEPHQIVGAIIQDVTIAELHREHIANKAKMVIQKNVMTVQKIANYLGEHMAETESLLREVATGYDTLESTGKTSDDGK